MATGALGTGIDIPGVIYIIYLGRLYGLTSFMQQAGRGGRAGEISDSIVILPSSGSGSHHSSPAQFLAPQLRLASVYSVEAQDEAALSEYLESPGCRRSVLAQHLDGISRYPSCRATDSIPCDRCSITDASTVREDHVQSSGSGSPVARSADMIYHALQAQVLRDEWLQELHQQLHPYCIYCILMLDEQ